MDSPRPTPPLVYPLAAATAGVTLALLWSARLAVARRAVAALVTAIVALGHDPAAGAPDAPLWHEALCERGSPLECAVAAAMLRQSDDPDDLVRAAALGARAGDCFAEPDREGCRVGHGEPETLCQLGDVASCRAAARLLVMESKAAAEDRWRPVALLQLACERGDMRSCVEAATLRAGAPPGRS